MKIVPTKLDQFRDLYAPKIEQTMANLLNSRVNSPKFRDYLAYSALSSGKKLRGLMFLATLKSLNQKIEPAHLEIAAGIEFIQTYSLVHDDLPAMDNDDFRRGQLSSHKKYSEAIAILVGDALNTLGFSVIANAQINPNKVQESLAVLTEATGINGMIEGQFLDILGTNQELTEAEIDQLEYQKTGAFFAGIIKMAAVIGDANEKAAKSLAAFAHDFGWAFQIYDDLIDAMAETTEAGKLTGKDEIQGKRNFVTQNGVTAAQEKLATLIKQMQIDLKDLGNDFLGQFTDLFKKVLPDD